jgi:hypothetical protein
MQEGESKIEFGMNSSRRDIMKKVTVFEMVMVLFLCMNLAAPPGLMAQGAQEEAAKQEGPSFRPEEVDQMVAPIALYPDSLLAQVLAASTYPLEIVQAARFVQQNKDLKGEKLMQAAKDKEWEPSVKAMLEFPDVLLMMNEKLEWTQKLGDAFLSQQKDVMTSVQRLRQKAQESGNLKTTKEQKVIVEEQTKVIIIEPASPQVVYVPTYNPAVVYGAWPYPAYPPYPVYPPGYVAGAALFSFGVGVAIGAAASSGYGGWGCGWGNNQVNINASTQNNFTKNNYNNSQKYQKNQNIKNQQWQHNPENRKGAQYPNQGTAQKYGQQRSGSGGRPTTSEARGYGGGAGEKGGGKPQTSDRSGGGGKESAFGGSGKGGSERASSNRGQESRSSASRSSGASSSSGGGSRSSGGGSRGGGGGGGGGRR